MLWKLLSLRSNKNRICRKWLTPILAIQLPNHIGNLWYRESYSVLENAFPTYSWYSRVDFISYSINETNSIDQRPWCDKGPLSSPEKEREKQPIRYPAQQPKPGQGITQDLPPDFSVAILHQSSIFQYPPAYHPSI